MAKTFEQALKDQLGMLAFEVTRLSALAEQQAEELAALRAKVNGPPETEKPA